ncbi:MAG: DegT/DnrJ/EryC1/StrS family aminotransferase [Candidatus Thorarchaeota archaeon]
MKDEKRHVMVSDLQYDQDEVDAVIEVLKSEWLTMGPKTNEFEKKLEEYLGADSVVAVNNGTAALHLALLGHGVGPGDEVIVTPLTFVACANSILYTGAKPVFVDIERNSWNLNPELVRKSISKKTKAIVPVHIAGLPVDMDELLDIADTNDLGIVDDAAHAIGSEYKGKKIGSFPSITTFSFFSNKNLSVGEGGAIATSDEKLAERLRITRSHGLTKSTWSRHQERDQESFDQLYDMVELGYNYRITEINAAIGCVQLGKLDRFNAHRSDVYSQYRDLLDGSPLEFQEIPSHVKHSHHVLPVLFPKGMRGRIRKELQDSGIGTSIHYTPIHRLSFYKQLGYSGKELPIANDVGDRVITLPLHQKLTEDDVRFIVAKIKESLKD